MTTDIAEKRERIERLVKYGVAGLGCAAAAPIAFMALEGLFAIIAFVVVAFISWNFAPVVATYIANKRIQALVAVVEANPIETMQNLFTEKSKELNDADTNISDFETEIRNYNDDVGTFKRLYPDEADTYQEISDKMTGALVDMKQQQSLARSELRSFELQINKAKAIYRMSQSASRVIRLSKSTEAQVFAKIKEQVAFDAVRSQLNRAFANLNLALERRRDARLLAEPTPAPKAEPAADQKTVVRLR